MRLKQIQQAMKANPTATFAVKVNGWDEYAQVILQRFGQFMMTPAGAVVALDAWKQTRNSRVWEAELMSPLRGDGKLLVANACVRSTWKEYQGGA